jgi:NAD dependent epimerase/dehydratase family enzyme
MAFKKVLIIGATSGIGRALATRLVENGIHVVISGRREENLQGFVRQHGSDKVKSKVVDVTKLDKVRRLMQSQGLANRSRSPNSPLKFSSKTPTSTASSSMRASSAPLISPSPTLSISRSSTRSWSQTTRPPYTSAKPSSRTYKPKKSRRHSSLQPRKWPLFR